MIKQRHRNVVRTRRNQDGSHERVANPPKLIAISAVTVNQEGDEEMDDDHFSERLREHEASGRFKPKSANNVTAARFRFTPIAARQRGTRRKEGEMTLTRMYKSIYFSISKRVLSCL
jgi:hypothetical protein